MKYRIKKNRRLFFKPLLLTLLTLIIFTGALAQSAEEAVVLLDNEQGFGIRAAAMGNAYTSAADDYSAIYWNPAGLAMIHHGHLYGSIYNLNYKPVINYQDASNYNPESFTKLKSLGMAIPFPVSQGSFVFAMGYQRINDLDNYIKFKGINPTSNDLAFEIDNELGYYGVLPFDRQLQQSLTVQNEGNISQWSFGAAADFSKNFSAGLTVNFYGGSSNYTYNYSQDDVNGANSYDIVDQNNRVIEEFYYNYYDVQQKISSEYSGTEFKAGGLLRFSRFMRIGATVTFPMDLKIKEDWMVTDELSYDILVKDENTVYEFIEAYELGSGTFDYIIRTPYKFSAGVSFHSPLIVLSASAEYRDWSQTRYVVPEDRDERDYTFLLDENKYFQDNFRPVINYAVGGELKLFDAMLNLRAGLRYNPSPFVNSDTTMDKKYLSVGFGLGLSENILLEASYTVGLWNYDKAYSYDWPTDKALITSEKYRTDKLVVGMRLYF